MCSGPLCYIKLKMNQKLTYPYVCAGTGHQSIVMTKFLPDINTFKLQRPKAKQYSYSQVFEVREVLKGLSVYVGQTFSVSNLSVRKKATHECSVNPLGLFYLSIDSTYYKRSRKKGSYFG